MNSMIYKNEEKFRKQYGMIAGVDEAGRGPLAGPVVVAAVILQSGDKFAKLNDSKKLTAKVRAELFPIIKQKAIKYSIIEVSPAQIDEMNILQATLWGMQQAVAELAEKDIFSLIDGNRVPKGLLGAAEAMVKGDSRFASIAAASILAKVHRDNLMLKLHERFPEYNFAKNKGYPTKEHMAAIRKYGITPFHRKSYRPVQQYTFNF
ncbi:MAG: ribonuclease [Candidatus Cloacimonadota bacterium]|nr:ribonuclease [Candidatus Cloacimonadota bacterium]